MNFFFLINLFFFSKVDKFTWKMRYVLKRMINKFLVDEIWLFYTQNWQFSINFHDNSIDKNLIFHSIQHCGHLSWNFYHFWGGLHILPWHRVIWGYKGLRWPMSKNTVNLVQKLEYISRKSCHCCMIENTSSACQRIEFLWNYVFSITFVNFI